MKETVISETRPTSTFEKIDEIGVFQKLKRISRELEEKYEINETTILIDGFRDMAHSIR